MSQSHSFSRTAFAVAMTACLAASAPAAVLDFTDTGTFGDLDPVSNGVGTTTVTVTVTDGTTDVKVTLSGTSLRSANAGVVAPASFALNNNDSRLGIDSAGGDANLNLENDPADELAGGNTYTETFTLLFTDTSDNPLSVEINDIGLSATAPGEAAIFTSDGNIASFADGNSFGSGDAGIPFLVGTSGFLEISASEGTTTGLASLGFTVVPEPASLILVGAGLALMAGRRRA